MRFWIRRTMRLRWIQMHTPLATSSSSTVVGRGSCKKCGGVYVSRGREKERWRAMGEREKARQGKRREGPSLFLSSLSAVSCCCGLRQYRFLWPCLPARYFSAALPLCALTLGLSLYPQGYVVLSRQPRRIGLCSA